MQKYLLLALAIPLLMANQGGCGVSSSSSAAQSEAAAVENNQQSLIAQTPPPHLTTSLERKNLVKRLARVNAENMTGFIYLIDHGVVMASYPINGKITSLNSYLASSQRTIWRSGSEYTAASEEQPDFDGAYGENDDGIFFFTADTDAYVEWHGDYLFSDQPLRLNQQPAMLRIMPSK